MMHFNSIVLFCLVYIACSMGQESELSEYQDKCNKEYSCYNVRCTEGSKGACNSLITYVLRENSMHFKIIAPKMSNGKYIAVGVNDKGGMYNASVVACILNNGGQTSIHSSYNILGTKSNSPQPQARGLNFVSGTFGGGTLICEFFQDLERVINGITFDLRLPMHILYATGNAQPNFENVAYHEFAVFSPSPILLTELQTTTILGDSGRTDKIKVHGCLMIFAWVFLTSSGIIFARYFKHMWPNNRLFGLLYWFQAHRALMLINVSCTIIAFILIMIANNGWKLAGTNPHPIIGLVTFILCLIQPCMALFRCKPDADKRYIFNWAHWFIGTSAHILSVASIFLGFQLAFIGKPEITNVLDGLMGTFVIVHIATEILLDMHLCIVTKTSAKSGSSKIGQSSQDVHLQDMSRSTGIPGMIPPPAGSKFKKIVLAVYLVIVFALMISMVCIIAIKL